MVTPTCNYKIRQATTVTDDEMKQLVELSLIAFDSAFGSMMIGDDEEFRPTWWKYWLTDSVLGAEVYFAENEEGKIVGYVVWYSPGTGPFATEQQRKEALDPIMAHLSPERRKWMRDDYMPQYMQLVDKALGEGVWSKCWKIHLIAVHPSFQKQGICKSLIDLKTQLPGGGHFMVSTGTELNTQIYQRLGFTLRSGHTALTMMDGKPFNVFFLSKEVPPQGL